MGNMPEQDPKRSASREKSTLERSKEIIGDFIGLVY
jgi:hypothetical protein